MSDYNLGTAHGKIVVDYEDKGNKKALADMEKLKAQAASIMGRMSALRKRWYADTGAMGSDVTRWGQQLGVFSGAAYLAAAGTIKFSQGINGLKGAGNMFSALGLSMGMVPKGAEKFPKVILDIIRITAAVGLIQGSLGLLGQLGAKFSTLRVGGPIFRAIGAAVSGLGMNVLVLSRHLGTLGLRFSALRPVSAVFFAMQRAVAALGVNVIGLGSGLSRMTLGLAPLARAPGLFGALSAAIGKAAAPLRLVSGLALSLAGTIAELNIAKGLIKPLLGIQSGVGGLSLAIKLVHSLASEIARLGGLLPLAIGGLFSLAAAGGIAMIAFKGFGEAIKSGDISKLHVEMGTAVTAVRGLGSEWTNFKKTIQGKVFAGLGPEISKFKGMLTQVSVTSGMVGTSINGIVKKVLEFGRSGVAINGVNNIMANTSLMLDNIKAAIWPFLEALMMIGEVGSSVFAELTNGLGGAAERFRNFISAARESGQLRAWMLAGVQSIKDLWNALKALKSVWDTVRAALSPGGVTPFFTALRQGAEALDRFLKSAKGQEALGTLAQMLARGETTLRALGDAIVTYVLPAIASFQPYITALSEGAMQGLVLGLEVLTPLFKGLGEALSFLAPIFKPIMASMVKTVVILGGLLLLFKIAGVAIFMLKYALDTVKLAMKITAFTARLLTGNLRKGEVAALKFAGTLIRNMVVALWMTIKAKLAAAAAMIRYVAMLIWGAVTSVASWVWARIMLVLQWLLIKISAIASAIRTGVVWVVQTIIATARTVAAWILLRVQIFVIWASLVIQSAVQATIAFLTWAVQSTIQTARTILAWVIMRVQIFAIWVSLVVQSAINATIAFATWAIQSTIATARMILAWTIARTQLILQWLLIRISALINAITAFIPWAIQSTIMAARMVLAWVIARTQLMLQWLLIKVSALINAITAFIPWVIQTTITVAQMIIAWTLAKVQLLITWVMMAVQSMMNAVRVAIAWVIANAPAIASAALALGAAIATVAAWVMAALGAMANAVIMAAAWFIALGPIGWVIAAVVALAILIIANWDKIKTWTMNAWNAVWNFIKSVWNGIVSAVTTGIARAVAFIITGWLRAKMAFTQAWNAMKQACASGIAAVIGFVASLPGKIKGFFSAAGQWLIAAGKAILTGLLDGLKAAWQASADFLSGLGAKIKSLKGPIDKDRKLLIPEGMAIMVGLCNGLKKGMPMLQKTLGAVTKEIKGTQAGMTLKNAAKGGTVAGAQAATAAISTWNPYQRPTGAGVDEQPVTNNDYSGMSVTIDGKTVETMKNVEEFFGAVEQKARAGSSGS